MRKAWLFLADEPQERQRLRVPVPETRFRSSSTAGIGDTRRGGFMQRFLTFVVLLLLTVPVGLSLQGCANKNSNYCNGVGIQLHGWPTSLYFIAAADHGTYR